MKKKKYKIVETVLKIEYKTFFFKTDLIAVFHVTVADRVPF